MADEGAGNKLLVWLMAAGLLAFTGWGVTYIPIVSDSMPSLIAAPPPTVELDLRDLSLNELESGRLPTDFLNDACSRIPFMLRPIASKPARAYVVITDGGDRLAKVTLNCRERRVVRTQFL